jgi:hypothetical protein
MRDYEKAEEWQGIKPYKNREKLGFDIFISNLDRQNHGSSSILEYDKIKKKYENEKDGRKKRSLLKLLKQELPAKKRFDELIKEKVFRDGCPRGIGIDPFDWNKVKDLEENHLYDNHGFVTIRGIDVEPEELNRFINDFDDTVTVFKINNPIKNYLLVFGLMGSYWTDGYNQGDGAEIQEKLKEWQKLCRAYDRTVPLLKRNGYYRQNKRLLLRYYEENDYQSTDRYKILAMIIHHEDEYGEKVSLTENIKQRRLIKLIEAFYSKSTIPKLFKNLKKN